jgi:hypothetical protein
LRVANFSFAGAKVHLFLEPAKKKGVFL